MCSGYGIERGLISLDEARRVMNTPPPRHRRLKSAVMAQEFEVEPTKALCIRTSAIPCGSQRKVCPRCHPQRYTNVAKHRKELERWL